MKVVVSSCGRYHSTHLARALQSRGVMQHFFSAGLPSDKKFFSDKKLTFFELLSLSDRIFNKFALDKFCALSRWYTWRDGIFDRRVAKLLPQQKGADIFVGWANSCYESLKVAKSMGQITIVEAGSMHILEQEKILEKEFAKQGLPKPNILQENKNRMQNEYKLADHIAVPSQHVKQSFIDAGTPSQKIIKVPYGCNVELFQNSTPKRVDGPINFLFVGMISLQKGTYYLLNAWRKLKISPQIAQLHLVGEVKEDCQHLVKAAQAEKSIFFHSSVRQTQLLHFYNKSHILLHPSLQDGLAMVIGEAMANGLLIIASKNSGGYELFKEGKSGFLINSESTEEIIEKITWCLNNRKKVQEMGIVAKESAQKLSWNHYGDKIIKQYQKILDVKNAKSSLQQL